MHYDRTKWDGEKFSATTLEPIMIIILLSVGWCLYRFSYICDTILLHLIPTENLR